jgi:hypothetical protein
MRTIDEVNKARLFVVVGISGAGLVLTVTGVIAALLDLPAEWVIGSMGVGAVLLVASLCIPRWMAQSIWRSHAGNS